MDLPAVVPQGQVEEPPARSFTASGPAVRQLAVSLATAAELVECDPKTFANKYRRMGVPYFRMGRMVRIPVHGLIQWMDEQTRKGAA